MDNINTRIAVYFLIVPIVLLQVLSITGCTSISPVVRNIFLLEDQAVDGDQATSIRIGYLGICARINGKTNCRSSIGTSAPNLQNDLFLNSEANDILRFARSLQFKIFLLLPAVSGIFFLLGTISFGLVKWYQKKTNVNSNGEARQGMFKRYALGFLLAAGAFALSSAIGLAQAIPALKLLSGTMNATAMSFQVVTGTTLQVLQWVLLAFMFLFTLGVWMMLRDVKDGNKKKTSGSKASTKKSTTKSKA